MNYWEVIIKYGIIVFLGFIIFYIDDQDFFYSSVTLALINVISILKTAYFIQFSYKKIIEISISEIAYHTFLGFMLVNISMIMLSFAVDYLCVYQVDPKSFVGIDPKFSFPELAFEFWYFSVLNFSFFGYGMIMPTTIPSKIVVMLEVLISFLSIVFILSDFVSLKESLSKRTNSTSKTTSDDEPN